MSLLITMLLMAFKKSIFLFFLKLFVGNFHVKASTIIHVFTAKILKAYGLSILFTFGVIHVLLISIK